MLSASQSNYKNRKTGAHTQNRKALNHKHLGNIDPFSLLFLNIKAKRFSLGHLQRLSAHCRAYQRILENVTGNLNLYIPCA